MPWLALYFYKHLRNRVHCVTSSLVVENNLKRRRFSHLLVTSTLQLWMGGWTSFYTKQPSDWSLIFIRRTQLSPAMVVRRRLVLDTIDWCFELYYVWFVQKRSLCSWKLFRILTMNLFDCILTALGSVYEARLLMGELVQSCTSNLCDWTQPLLWTVCRRSPSWGNSFWDPVSILDRNHVSQVRMLCIALWNTGRRSCTYCRSWLFSNLGPRACW